MDPKREKMNTAENQNSVSISEEELGQTQPENIGRLRKLLDWISKGAAKSKTGTTGCPT